MKQLGIVGRAWGLVLAGALLLGGCAPGAGEESQPQTPSAPGQTEDLTGQRIDTLKIAYNNADSLNPYEASSMMNLNMLSLVYDPLVKLDRSFTRHNVIAQEVRTEGLTCAVTLRPGLVFSDGSPLTADDVLYSVQQVRLAGGSYQGLLDNVESVEGSGLTVTFTLLAPDRLFANLLTFPVVKRDQPTVGSGRYVLRGGGEKTSLEWNEHWYGSGRSRIKSVELVNQLDKDTLIYSLKLGTINYAYTDQESGEIVTQGVGSQEVPLNNLIYLGLNHTKTVLSYMKMRQTLALGMDRAALVSTTLGSRAEPASAPFHPLAVEVAPGGGPRQRDLEAADALFAEQGYRSKNGDGYYVSYQDVPLRMRLLVNADNGTRMQLAEMVRKQMAELGVEITIDARTFEEYKRALEMWDFDLYLGEVKLYSNMDISNLLSSKARLGFGIVDYEELQTANAQLKAGEIDAAAFTAVFDQYVPFIPLMYRSGAITFSRDAYFDTEATEQDIFYNIESW